MDAIDTTPLEQFVDPSTLPEPSARITIRPTQALAPPPVDDMQAQGLPDVTPPARDVAQPIRVTPVEHEPEFHHELVPVEHKPDFLTDEQLHHLASQKGTLAPQSWETGAGKLGAGVVEGYKDYFDPFTKNDQGVHVADTNAAITPNAAGKLPEVTKDPVMNSILLALDVGSNFVGPGTGAGLGAGVKAIMAGVGARAAPLAKLMKAEAFESAKMSPEAIRQATGWFRGADGGWRFEIPDTEARFVAHAQQARNNLLKEREAALWAEWQKVKDPVTDTLLDPVRGAEIAQAMRDVSKQLNQPLTMKDILDHPELYKQYPHIGDMPVEIKDLGGAVRGQQIPGVKPDPNLPWDDLAARPGKIELDRDLGTNRLTTLHEIQHEVQDTEKFARGGNYSTPEVSAEATAATGLRRSELIQEVKDLTAQRDAWVKEHIRGSNVPEAVLAGEFWDKHPDLAKKLNELEAATMQLNAAHQRALRDAYKRLAGEVESRQVEARAGLTPRELERRPPIMDEDVPRDKQIVIHRADDANHGATASIDDEGAVNRGLQEFPDEIEGGYGQRADQAAAEAKPAPAVQPRGAGGAEGVAEAQGAAEAAAGSARPLQGLPQEPLIIKGKPYVPGPIGYIHDIAENYMKSTGRQYKPLTTYQPVDVKRATRIAAEYAKMPHAPNDPAVKASYDAMIDETIDQLKAMQKSGVKIEFIKPGMKDPYEETPRLAHLDLRDNHHLWVYPTDAGFGSGAEASAAELADNPLLRPTGISIDGRELLANDAFRIVHDFFGHLKDGVGFRAGGEENAWRSHSRMYSAKARPAMTSETRGQNSWLNYGPHGAKNRTAKSADTIYADQKTGIMPNWTHLDGAADPYVAPKMTDARGHESVNAGVDAPPNKKVQTVADPHRMMFPGIYENPRVIAKEASERVAPESLDMKRLWGVSRGDLDEMAKGRVGNEEPRLNLAKNPRGSLSAQNIQTPKNTQRIQDVLVEAGKHQGLKHADAWYILDPVYQQMERMWGPEQAKVRFERLNTMMGMASPGSEVTTEIQRGTAAHHMVSEGRFEDFLKHAGTPREFRKGPKDLQHVEAHPYHRTAQAEPMQKYLESGSIQSDNVKVPAYVHASGTPETGFQTSGPVGDAHFARGTGLSDTRKGPTDVAGSISRPEYQTLQPWWRDEVAGPLGLESVPAQARMWTALGPRTGVNSALGQGKLELLTQQIMKAAKRLGVSPETARDLILSGKASAGAVGAGVVGGAAAADRLQEFVD